MILGLIEPTSGHARVMGAEMPRERYRVLHRMNFESPVCRHAEPADGAGRT